MDTFKKHFINDYGNYKIGYWHDGVFQKFVNEDKPMYVAWLGAGNTPEEVAFINPPTPAEPSIEKLRNDVRFRIIEKQNQGFDKGFVFEGDTYPSDSQHREMMATAKRVGQKAIDAGTTTTLTVLKLDGTPVSMDQTKLVAIQEAYDDYGLSVYNTFITEMDTLGSATADQLKGYLKNGAF